MQRPPLFARRVGDWSRAHPLRAGLLMFAVACAIIGGILLLRYVTSYIYTDDAQVDGHITAVSTRVSGTVLRVYVEENQPVVRGQLLVEIDPRDAQLALERAQAELDRALAELQASHPQVPITATTSETRVSTSEDDVDTAEAALAAAERDHESALARLKEAQANATRAQADLSRYRFLLREQAVPRERYDEKLASARALAASVDSNRALARASEKAVEQQRNRLEQAHSRRLEADSNAPRQVSIQEANVLGREAAVKVSRAQLAIAQKALDDTRILAPISGIIGKRSVEPGDHVDPGVSLFALVNVTDLWVTANFKETQLRRVHPGQRATVAIDTLGRAYDGDVESVGAATGARLSLFPPENATGNFVKVVQRIPVRIRLRPDQGELGRIRPGMSVEPKIWIR